MAKGFARFKRDNTKYGKRHRPGEMNQTESLYADLLNERVLAGFVVQWIFEGVTLKLADASRYTPDFMVLLDDDSIEFVNVKGGGPIDPNSLTKHKFAADKFWMFHFVMEKKLPKRDGGGWQRTEF